MPGATTQRSAVAGRGMRAHEAETNENYTCGRWQWDVGFASDN